MTWLVVGAVVPSMAVCWAAAWLLRRLAPRLGLLDRPGHRKIHRAPTPTSGGLAIWLGIVAPLAAGNLALWLLLTGATTNLRSAPGLPSSAAKTAESVQPRTAGQASSGTLPAQPTWLRLPEFIAPHLPGLLHQASKLWILLAGGTALMLLGLADDRRGLDWRLRLGVQTFVAAAMTSLGWRVNLIEAAPAVNAIISVLWIVGLVNSFNMLDNMDGLSAGVAAIAAMMLAVVMFLAPRPDNHQPQLFVGGFLLVIFGALLGFLLHNRPPARLFMGNAGSYLVGYLLAMATLTGTFAGGSSPRHAALAPLCAWPCRSTTPPASSSSASAKDAAHSSATTAISPIASSPWA